MLMALRNHVLRVHYGHNIAVHIGVAVATGPLTTFNHLLPGGHQGPHAYNFQNLIIWEMDPRSAAWRTHNFHDPLTNYPLPHGVNDANGNRIATYDFLGKLDEVVPLRGKCTSNRLYPLVAYNMTFASFVGQITRAGFEPRQVVWQVMGNPSTWARICDDWSLAMWFNAQWKQQGSSLEIVVIGWADRNTPEPDVDPADPTSTMHRYIPETNPPAANLVPGLIAPTARSRATGATVAVNGNANYRIGLP